MLMREKNNLVKIRKDLTQKSIRMYMNRANYSGFNNRKIFIKGAWRQNNV